MIKTTAEIVFEETKCIHNCCMSDGLKRKNKEWIPVKEVKEAIENAIKKNGDECYEKATIKRNSKLFDKYVSFDAFLKYLKEELNFEETE